MLFFIVVILHRENIIFTMQMNKKTITTAIASFLLMIGGTIKAQNKMDNTLNEKQQNLIAVAAFEAKGDLEGLKTAVNNALDAKLTINEVKEALSQLYAYTGFPRSLNGLGVLQSVLKARGDKGINDNEGADATPMKADYDALKEGTERQTKITGGKPFKYTFVPATDYYLKAHLFGDIFARDVLTYAERELVTVGALASMEGVEPQLKAHVRGALNMGVTKEELKALTNVLAERVGDVESYRAKKAVAEQFGETFQEVKPFANMSFPKGEPNTAYAKYFIGNSYLAPLLKDTLPISNVTFEPGCRNNWHIHHKASQILICVGGEGWYQEWGKPARKLHAGDVVNIAPEVKHWHGATADSWFQHIAVHVPVGDPKEASNEWLEPVADEDYNKL